MINSENFVDKSL